MFFLLVLLLLAAVVAGPLGFLGGLCWGVCKECERRQA